MFNLPRMINCGNCKQYIPTGFINYDTECGNPNPLPGVWEVDVYCHLCEHINHRNFTVKIEYEYN